MVTIAKAPESASRYSIDLTEAKRRLTVFDAWRLCHFTAEPAPSCRCPFHDDRNPSFSIFDEGRGWKCFAGCGGGDVVNFVEQALSLTTKDAIETVIEWAGGRKDPVRTTCPKVKVEELRPMTFEEQKELAASRNLGLAGIIWATNRGVLKHCTIAGHACWAITDSAGMYLELRRMDRQPFRHGGKSHTIKLPDADGNERVGKVKTWPCGIIEASHFSRIALVEGGPDFLAAHDQIIWEQLQNHHQLSRPDLWNCNVHCAPVAMLGAAMNIHPEALPYFKAKLVRIFPHRDEAGEAAADRWRDQLKAAGAGGVQFYRITRSECNDLSDLWKYYTPLQMMP